MFDIAHVLAHHHHKLNQMGGRFLVCCRDDRQVTRTKNVPKTFFVPLVSWGPGGGESGAARIRQVSQ